MVGTLFGVDDCICSRRGAARGCVIIPIANTNDGKFHPYRCLLQFFFPWPRPPASLIITIASPPCSGELRTQELKSYLLRTQTLKVLPLKPGVGQYIATHARLSARDFFLVDFYPSGPFICIFPQNFSRVFPVLAVANACSM